MDFDLNIMPQTRFIDVFESRRHKAFTFITSDVMILIIYSFHLPWISRTTIMNSISHVYLHGRAARLYDIDDIYGV